MKDTSVVNWFKANEKLPENTNKVLVYSKERGIDTARFYNGVFYKNEDFLSIVNNVIKWAALPLVTEK